MNQTTPSSCHREYDVLLINPPFPQRHGAGLIPPIGLAYLASALREQGAQPTILDLATLAPGYDMENPEPMIAELESFFATNDAGALRLVGIGPLVTASLRSTKEIIAVCRDHTTASIVLGGPLCAVPGISEVVDSYLRADYFVAGDGESPIVELWRAASRCCLPLIGKGIGRPGEQPPAPNREPILDSLALPARDLLDTFAYCASSRRSTTAGSVTAAFLSRGCPYSCSFCAAPLSSGKLVRRLTASRIADELSSCAAAGNTHIIFYDDCLFVRSPRLDGRIQEFTEAISRSSWRGTYQLELRCDAVVSLSEASIRGLIESGCRQLNLGIEKGQSQHLDRLRKRLSPEVARDAVNRVAETVIRVAGTFIVGGPDESADDLDSTIDFATSLPLDYAQFNPLAIYPGTRLYDEVYGAERAHDWLDMCLDSDVAPRGDILWQSRSQPLSAIIAVIAEGYHRFYDGLRLRRLLSKVPAVERSIIEQAYDTLSRDRACSWSNSEAPTTHCAPPLYGS